MTLTPTVVVADWPSVAGLDQSGSYLQSILNSRTTATSIINDKDNSTDARMVRSLTMSVFRPLGGSKGRLVSVLVEFITRAARNEHAVPHNMAKDTATFTEGPKNRSEDPGKHDDVLYPLKPLVVCILAPGNDVAFK